MKSNYFRSLKQWFIGKTHLSALSAKIAQADLLAVIQYKSVVRDSPDNIYKVRDLLIEAGNDHAAVVSVFQMLAFFQLRLDPGAKSVIYGFDYIDPVFAEFVKIRQRTFVY